MGTAVERKYVMISFTMPITFISQTHKEMEVHGPITSAGFFRKSNGRIETYGQSVSLKGMKPHPDDAEILEHFFGL